MVHLRTRPTHVLFVAILWLAVPVGADAATVCVNPGGTGGCLASLQDAVDVASDGDTVAIAAGSYAERVVIEDRRLVLQGAGAGATVVDLTGASSSVDALSIRGRSTVEVSDLTIRRDQTGGSGVLTAGTPSVVLRRIVVEGFEAGLRLGGNARVGVVESHVRGGNPYGVLADGRLKLELVDSTISDAPTGIFMYWFDAARAKITLERTTVRDAEFACVALSGRITADVTASTISGCGAAAIGFEGSPRIRVRIRSSTLADSQFGLRGDVSRTHVQLVNSIVASAGPGCTPAGLRIKSFGYNVLSDPTGCTLSGPRTGDALGVDPLLGPLAENGGPTPTHALLPGSPAIDAGNPAPPGGALARCTATDQRGVPRTGRCDAGAFEAP